VTEELNEPMIAIIGAGVTGLCAMRRLEELGYANYYVLEQSEKLGGLASSILDKNGFRWDLGVHVIFSHFEFFDAILDEALPPSAWIEHSRKSPAFMRGRFVGYPVQDNLVNFPEAEAERILNDLESTRADRQRCADVTGKVNFAEWMHYCFGEELTASFGRPYNSKVCVYVLVCDCEAC
jgi:protoporphyrinogen oxidase